MKSSHSSKAWLLEYQSGCFTAISIYSMKELISKPKITRLPFSPRHWQYLYRWNGRIVPVLDLQVLISDKHTKYNSLLIVAFENQEKLLYGSFLLANKPVIIDVKDEQFCSLPNDSRVWQQRIWEKISASCFLYKKQPTPILNLSSLFLTTEFKNVNTEIS